MKNYYVIIGVTEMATIDEIYTAYNNKISQFRGLPFHTLKMQNEIKQLKEAKYILLDVNRRGKYNIILKKQLVKSSFTTKEIDSTKICERLFSIVDFTHR